MSNIKRPYPKLDMAFLYSDQVPPLKPLNSLVTYERPLLFPSSVTFSFGKIYKNDKIRN
jgi:hypothetical protein